jgi:hypothetical protein
MKQFHDMYVKKQKQKFLGKKASWKLMYMWWDTVYMDCWEIYCEDMNWIQMVELFIVWLL